MKGDTNMSENTDFLLIVESIKNINDNIKDLRKEVRESHIELKEDIKINMTRINDNYKSDIENISNEISILKKNCNKEELSLKRIGMIGTIIGSTLTGTTTLILSILKGFGVV